MKIFTSVKDFYDFVMNVSEDTIIRQNVVYNEDNVAIAKLER